MYEHRFFVSLALWYEVAYPSHSTLGWRRGVRTVQWYTATRLKTGGVAIRRFSPGKHFRGQLCWRTWDEDLVGGPVATHQLLQPLSNKFCSLPIKKKKKKLPKRCNYWHQGVLSCSPTEFVRCAPGGTPTITGSCKHSIFFTSVKYWPITAGVRTQSGGETRNGDWVTYGNKRGRERGGIYVFIYVTGVHGGNRRWNRVARDGCTTQSTQ